MAIPNNFPPRNPRFGSRFQPKKKENEHNINADIRASEVRVVGENADNEIHPTREAIKMAEELGVDLVEVVPNAEPPVCRLVDYQKFLYEKKKKEKEMKSKQVKNVMKEIRFTPNTDDHDFDFKAKHAENFLKEGAKVRAYVDFRGRAIMYKERGELLLLKFVERLTDVGAIEQLPKLEGKRMFVTMNPKKKA